MYDVEYFDDVKPKEPVMHVSEEVAKEFYKGFTSEEVSTAQSLGITPAKLKSARQYAANLAKQDKRMKQSTIRKKVAEKFKIKLV